MYTELKDRTEKMLEWFVDILETKTGIAFGWGFIVLLLLALLIEITA